MLPSPMMSPIPLPSVANHGWPALPDRGCLLMGVLNLTPNSFSDGGSYADLAEERARALAIAAEGADILDIGGESTHPLAAPISAEEELARVLPVLDAVAGHLTLPISIDTYKAVVAEAALKRGARIVNDVWGLQRDPDMAAVVAAHGAGLCIMHNRQGFDPDLDVFGEMRRYFDRSLDLAEKAGIARAAIMLDPGIGFGKTFDQNLMVLDRLEELHDYGLPLLIGCSRKGFIGKVTGRTEPKDRLIGSLAAHVAAALKGAAVIRAHDIAPHREALAMAAAIRRQRAEPGV